MKMLGIKTILSDEVLKEIAKKQDNTLGPLGSGGYAVKEGQDGFFHFTELDCAPARTYKVGIRSGQVWTNHLVELFSGLLMKRGEGFSIINMDFPNQEAAEKAFFEMPPR